MPLTGETFVFQSLTYVIRGLSEQKYKQLLEQLIDDFENGCISHSEFSEMLKKYASPVGMRWGNNELELIYSLRKNAVR